MNFLFAGCHSKAIILHEGLSETDALEIIVFLQRHNIEAEKVKNTKAVEGAPPWMIAVKNSQRNEAFFLLKSNGFPRKKEGGLLDIFKGGGWFPRK